MGLLSTPSNLPARTAAGAFILNSGVDKWDAPAETAKGLHAMAADAYPFLEAVDPEDFANSLSGSEILIGSLLLTPLVPDRLAGLILSAFAGGLLGMYVRKPELRKEGSLRPSSDGIAIAKDSWLLGIGLSLILGGFAGRSGDGRDGRGDEGDTGAR